VVRQARGWGVSITRACRLLLLVVGLVASVVAGYAGIATSSALRGPAIPGRAASFPSGRSLAHALSIPEPTVARTSGSDYVYDPASTPTAPIAKVAVVPGTPGAVSVAAVRLSGRGSRFLVAAEEGASGGTQLFRVTGPDETADINATGGYRVPEGGTEGKYFYPTEEQANAMAGKMAAQGYPSPLSLTSGYASPDVLGGFDSIAPAGEGPAYFAPGDSSSSLTNVTVHGQYP